MDLLWTFSLVALVLWFLGMMSGHTAGNMIHVLLAAALILAVIRLFQGRRERRG